MASRAAVTTVRFAALRSAGSALLALVGGPLGLAIGVTAGALYFLATRETEAERATRLHEEAQRSFARVIDATTGKIRENTDDAHAIASRDRPKLLAALRGEQLQWERIEESAIDAGATQGGALIVRRGDCDIRAVLGLADSLPAPRD